MIDHFSKGIQNIIQTELFKAEQSILIAVAWFTNNLLFQPLLLKLGLGVKVTILLNRDEINDLGETSLDFEHFKKLGGILYWNETNRLLHDKFCIIDNSIVIVGSYNWTYKANFNEESITVYRNEFDTISFYQKMFDSLVEKYNVNDFEQRSFSDISVPQIIAPYSKLRYYDKIDFATTGYTDFLFGFSLSQGHYALLDNESFLPKTSFIFSEIGDYRLIYKPCKSNMIWVKGDTKWGLFDCDKLEYAIHPNYDKVNSCRSLFGVYVVYSNNKVGMVDINGHILLPCVYDDIIENDSKKSVLLKRNNHYGLYFLPNKSSIPCDYDKISILGDGEYASILKDNKYGLSYQGSIVSQFTFESIKCDWYGLPIVQLGGLFGLYNQNELTIPCNYTSIDCRPYGGRLYICCINGKFGVLNAVGTIVLDFVYDKIDYGEPFGRKKYYLEQNGKKGAYYIAENYLWRCGSPDYLNIY